MDSSNIAGVNGLGLVIAPKARTETRIGVKEKEMSKACLHLHLCYSANYNSVYGRLYYKLVEWEAQFRHRSVCLLLVIPTPSAPDPKE